MVTQYNYMITSTVLGRLQTKAITYFPFALVTAVFAAIGGEVYVSVFAIAMLVGIVLETLWGMVVWYQPGWYSFMFGAIECAVIVLVTSYFGIAIALPSALLYYLVSWCVIQLFVIYIMPVFRMCWGENGGEIW